MKNEISANNKAPLFLATTFDGKQFDLTTCIGKKTWLAFYRYASCPLCNLRIREKIKRHELYKAKGLEIIAIFQSPPESMSMYVGQQAPLFPLISDPQEKIYELYGLNNDLNFKGMLNPKNIPIMVKAMKAGFRSGKMEGTITRLPADFLINESGVIQSIFRASAIGEHISFSEVDSFCSQ